MIIANQRRAVIVAEDNNTHQKGESETIVSLGRSAVIVAADAIHGR
jgi:hypothetical protein